MRDFLATQPLKQLFVSTVAATALRHGLTVVTRDVGDFAQARVPAFDPWAAG